MRFGQNKHDMCLLLDKKLCYRICVAVTIQKLVANWAPNVDLALFKTDPLFLVK